MRSVVSHDIKGENWQLTASWSPEAGFRAFHQQDASLMALVRELGTVFGLTLIAGLAFFGGDTRMSDEESEQC